MNTNFHISLRNRYNSFGPPYNKKLKAMPKLRSLLIGNDQQSFKQIYEFATKISWLTVMCKPVNAREARHYLQEFDIDILLCDAAVVADEEMAAFLSREMPNILIIVVASETALLSDNIGCNVFSYLSRPVSFDAFLNALSRAKDYIQATEQKEITSSADFVFIKSEYKFYKIKFDEILFCEVMKDYTKVYLVNNPKPLITLQNLKSFANKLPSGNFIRVHRSFVVSLSNVDIVTRTDIAIGQRSIPIGESYRNSLFRFIQ